MFLFESHTLNQLEKNLIYQITRLIILNYSNDLLLVFHFLTKGNLKFMYCDNIVITRKFYNPLVIIITDFDYIRNINKILKMKVSKIFILINFKLRMLFFLKII